MFNLTARKCLLMAGALLATPLAMVPAAGIGHANSVGVKSLDFIGVVDSCYSGQALPCTPGAGEGESNILRITQSKENGYYKFNGTETTGQLADHVWLSADIGAACRPGWKLFRAEINGSGNVDEGLWSDISEVGVWVQDIDVPNAKSMPVKRVTANMPIGGIHGPLDDGTIEALFADGEAEIQQRIDDGMKPSEARALPFSGVMPITMTGRVVCRGNVGLHIKYYKDLTVSVPLTVEFVPVEVGVIEKPELDLVSPPEVTDVNLSVLTDPADPCTLYLSAVIQTNGPMDVEYRFINQYGQPSNTYTVAVDGTQVAYVDKSVAIPMIESPDPGGDLVAVDGPGEIGGKVAEVNDEQYTGTFMIEVISPNHKLDGDGFVVDYCETGPVRLTGLGGDAPTVFVGQSSPTRG